MEKRIRIPFCGTINLFIETLTGTCFELRVSPFETVLSVKAKIQRLEGIPISQQHLIWEGTELQDDFCLHDYRIRSNSTVRLVIALRGGPINTRRITVDEPSFLDMADYIDANQEEILEELSIAGARNSGKNDDSQVTLLVYRNGDQVNFFRVIDRGDGALTPVSEPFRTRSLSELGNVDDIVNKPKFTTSRLKENRVTASKMKKLQNRMQHLKLKDSLPQRNNANDNERQQNKNSGKASHSLTDGGPAERKRSPKQLTTDVPSYFPFRSPLQPEHPPAGKPRLLHDVRPKVSFNRHDMYLRSYGLLPTKKGNDEEDASPQSQEKSPPSTTSSAAVESIWHSHVTHVKQPTYSSTSRRTECSPSIAHNPVSATLRSSDMPDSRHVAENRSEDAKPAIDSRLPLLPTKNTISMTTTTSTFDGLLHRAMSTRNVSDLADHSSLNDTGQQRSVVMKRNPGSTSVSELTSFSSPYPKLNAKVHNHQGEGFYCNTNEDLKIPTKPRTPVSVDPSRNVPVPPSFSRNSTHCSSSLLPPVRPLVIKKKRCFCCGKKTGLATSYTCRCGRNFCATHRYAEAHDCTFDYKSAGRQLLKETNPIVSAPKLPKI